MTVEKVVNAFSEAKVERNMCCKVESPERGPLVRQFRPETVTRSKKAAPFQTRL
jgi:hypothetical protein